MLLGIAPVIGAGVWLGTAPVFDLTPEIQIETGVRVPEQWVRSRLDPLVGSNLPLLSLERAKERLRNHWISEAKLIKKLPNELTVQIVEHEPVGVFEFEGRPWVVSHDGRVIVECARTEGVCGRRPRTGPRAPEGVDGGVSAEARADAELADAGDPETALVWISIQSPVGVLGAEAGATAGADGSEATTVTGSNRALTRTLKRALDVATEARAFDWGRDVVAVEVLSEDDYLLVRHARPATVLVRGRDLTAKGSVYQVLQASIGALHDPDVVDLRFRDRIVLPTEAPDVPRAFAPPGRAQESS